MKILPHSEVEAAGYALFNGNDHLCVDVPDGQFTITAKTSQGKRITFAFLPSQYQGPPTMVDVAYHDNGTSRQNGQRAVPTFDALALGKGSNLLYDSRKTEGALKPGIVCILMGDAE